MSSSNNAVEIITGGEYRLGPSSFDWNEWWEHITSVNSNWSTTSTTDHVFKATVENGQSV